MDLCLPVIQCSPPDVLVHAKYQPDCTTWLDFILFSGVLYLVSVLGIFNLRLPPLFTVEHHFRARDPYFGQKNALLQCPPNKRTNLVIISLNMPFCIHFITNKKYQNKLSTYIYKTLGCPIYMQMYTHRLCGTVISYNCRIFFRCSNMLIPYIQCRMHCSAVFGEL